MKSSYRPRKHNNTDEHYETTELDPDSIVGLSREAKALLKSKKEIKLFNQRGRKTFVNDIPRDQVTYKDIHIIKQFLNPMGGILSSRITQASRKHQNVIKRAIKRAREIGLLPFPNQRESAEFFQ